MSDPLISRIYEVKINGYEQSLKNLKAVTTAFQQMDATKKLTDQELKKAIEVGNAASINQLTARVKELEASLKNLDAQREKSAKEVALLAKAEKDEASAKAIITKSIIDQDKELDRQIALQEKQRQQSEKNRLANEAEAGSYKDIVNQQKQLRPFIQSTAPNSSATIDLNGQTLGITQAIEKFKELSFAEQAFRRQFQADGTIVGEYTTGIVQAFNKLGLGDVFRKQKDDINNQLRQLQADSQQLAQQLKQAGDVGASGFKNIDAQLRQNILDQERLTNSLHNIDAALDQTGGIGRSVTTSIKEGFSGLLKQATQFAVGFVGIQAAFGQLQNAIMENARLSDVFANLQIFLHGSKEDVDKLVESLRKIPTRTSLEQLADISTIVAKKGVAKEEIAGVTQALDSLFVVLGKEAGDPHEATASLVKLITIFTEDKHVTAERVNEIGASIQKLTSSGVATGSFLIDFAERVGSVRGITGLALPNILGMGAALQQLGQRSETASTAAIQLTTKMFGNVPKFAEAAGKSVEEFRKLLKDNPFDALVALAENLKNSGKDFEDVTAAFGEVGITGSRIKAVLGDIATNGAFVSQKMKAAGVSTQDYANLASAAAIKQNTFAASLDKISKAFEKIGTDKSVQIALMALAGAISFVVGNLGVIIAAISAYSLIWAVANASMIATRISTLAANIAFTAQYAVLVVGQTVTKAYATSVALLSTAFGEAAVTSTVLGTAIKALAGPLGIILAIGGLLAISFTAFGKTLTGASTGLSSYIRQQNILGEVSRKANEAVADQTSKLAGWVSVVNSASASADTKRLALQKLIDQYPVFSNALKGEVIDLQEVKRAYEQVTSAIRAKAEADASASLTAEKQKDVLAVSSTRQKLEAESAKTKGDVKTITGFSQDELNRLFDGINLQQTSIRVIDDKKGTIQFLAKDFERLKGNLNRQQDEAINVFNDYAKVQGNLQAKLAKIEADATVKTSEAGRKNAENNKLSIEELEKLIQGLDAQIRMLKEGDPKIKQLQKLREDYQARIDAINNKARKEKEFTGSRIAGVEKDAFRDIDAQRDEQIAALKLAMQQKSEFERSTDKSKSDKVIIRDEETFLNELLRLNLKAIDDKLKIAKDGNAAERKSIAELHLDRINQEQETLKKIFDIRAKELQQNFELSKQANQSQLDNVLENPNSNASTKAAARENFNNQQFIAQSIFNDAMLNLEKQFNQRSVEAENNRQQAIDKINKDSRNDKLLIAKAHIDDLKNDSASQIEQVEGNYAALRKKILDNEKLTADQKNRLIDKLNKAEQRTILSAELDTLNKQVAIEKQLLDANLITNEEYLKSVAAQKKKAEELSKVTSNKFGTATVAQPGQGGILDLIKSQTKGKLSVGTDSNGDQVDGSELLGNVLAQSYSVAQQAMSGYFDAERARVEESRKLANQRIDIEKEQLLAQAQSQAERDSIEKQAAAKKEKADKEAGERLKKIKKSEAKIAFATELANIAVAAAQNPLNGITLGAAGIAMYALLAGLAAARYALNVRNIDTQTFATGGYTGKGTHKDETGHKVAGVVHNDEWVAPKWMNEHPTYGKTIYQLEKVRKRGFATGGYTSPIGSPSLGSSLQAPVNPRSFLSTSSSSNGDIAELKQMVVAVTDSVNNVSNRVDNLKVHVVAREVEDVNTKTAKAARIGTL
jgi:hypothetical protein